MIKGQLFFLLFVVSVEKIVEAFSFPGRRADYVSRTSPSSSVGASFPEYESAVDMGKRNLLALVASSVILATSSPAVAVSDISGQDLSGQDYSNRDFSGVVAKKTNFRNCNLKGSVFKNANLVGADFSGADVRGATFSDAVLDGTSFANVQGQQAVFSKTILDIANFENADLTGSLWPSKC